MSCILSNPGTPEATKVVDHVLAHACARRHEGITFGGRGLISSVARLQASLTADVDLNSKASKELEVYGDATWNLFNVYGLIVLYHGAAVFHQTKRIAIMCDSSHRSEAMATSKGGEIATYAREVLGAASSRRAATRADVHRHGQQGQHARCERRGFGNAQQALCTSVLHAQTARDRRQHRAWTRVVHDVNNPADSSSRNGFQRPSPKLAQSLQYASNNTASVPSAALKEADA